MLNHFEFPSVPDMHEAMCRKFMLGKLGTHYNWQGTSEVGMDNLTIGVPSFDFNYDFKKLWITRHRWNLMVRQYIDPIALENTLGMVETYMGKNGKAKRGIATMRMASGMDLSEDDDYLPDGNEADIEVLRTKMVKSWFAGKQTSRRWGSCMLNLTFRMVPQPTVTLNSRTTYFGFLALLDVNVANVFARLCGDIVGVDPGEMQFVWQLNLAQFHGFRCLAWSLGNPEMKAILDKHVDNAGPVRAGGRHGLFKQLVGYKKIVKFDREGLLYGDETYSSYSRVRRRFHTEVLGYDHGAQFEGGTYTTRTDRFPVLPHLWSKDLDFRCLERKQRRGRAEEAED